MHPVKKYLLRKIVKLLPWSLLSHDMILTVDHDSREYMIEIYVFDVTDAG